MGLFDFFKNRNERESALPDGMSMSDPSSLGALSEALGQSLSGQPAVSISSSQNVVDLQDQGEELRTSILETLKAHGIDAEQGQSVQITDPSVATDIFKTLSEHGLDASHMGMGAAAFGAMPATTEMVTQGDSISQLERLGKLYADGVLTDSEFSEQKRKVLGQ